MTNSPLKGLIALLRLPYWLMTGGLSLLTAFALLKDPLNMSLQTALLIFFSMAFITSAGFAINDYFDRESDAIIKPKRPLPAGALTLKQVVAISSILFAIGLSLTYWLPPLSFAILAVDSLVLILYSYLVKKKSGFLANIVVGILTGTAFLYGQAAISGTITLISLSLYPIAFGTIGGNVLRDVLSVEGDTKVGYPTLPQKIGNYNAAKVGAFFFLLTGLLAPLPALPLLPNHFTIYYLPLILTWSVLLIYSSVRLFLSGSTVQNVRKYERIVTMSMMLLPLALIVEAIAGWII
ncbi:UbiA family prenyltransferase [Candidatus Bathycorpusculum sp.]|uniref:UbiA family prenyltransferase n=1 Tax=Candidatus Bathycorpusculum sp. TaxID=2994959 RepID=UPI00281AB3BE|nr:UbiA family prenyltransferase [Candidatus Termitimicrobium sp.]MCL2431189.1 UbiA family prenyltransferase [Candidatus Termitimicrobium sp.]